MADKAPSVSCLDCFNALVYCFGVSHQADRYYKDGAFDSCAAQRKDLMTCAWLARATPAEKKEWYKRILEANQSRTEGVIWKARTTPLGSETAPTSTT